MRITICSIFRNSEKYLHRYFEQIEELILDLAKYGNTINLLLGEGDSNDRTRESLPKYGYEIVDVTHGGKEYGSIVNPIRFANLAKAWNTIWETIPVSADAVVFLEADLKWRAEDLIHLIEDLMYVSVVSPMIMCGNPRFPKNQFYDIWAFRKEGKQFNPHPPYFKGYCNDTDLVPLDSSGSCVVMKGDIARRIRFTPDDVIVGMCSQIRSMRYGIWMDQNVKFIHP